MFKYHKNQDLDQLNEDINIHEPNKHIKTSHHSDMKIITDHTSTEEDNSSNINILILLALKVRKTSLGRNPQTKTHTSADHIQAKYSKYKRFSINILLILTSKYLKTSLGRKPQTKTHTSTDLIQSKYP